MILGQDFETVFLVPAELPIDFLFLLKEEDSSFFLVYFIFYLVFDFDLPYEFDVFKS